MQSTLIAGDSLLLRDSLPAHPASAGWVLKYRLTPAQSDGALVELTAAADGDDFVTLAGSSVTATWVPGGYAWSKSVSKSDIRLTLDYGQLTVLPDPSSLRPGTDTRSHLAKVVAAIEAMLEGRASRTEQEYTIANRSLKHIPIPELLAWLDKYKFQLAQEQAATSGGPFRRGRRIYMRF